MGGPRAPRVTIETVTCGVVYFVPTASTASERETAGRLCHCGLCALRSSCVTSDAKAALSQWAALSA
eukprot:3076266-Prymnesium_polylepis.1